MFPAFVVARRGATAAGMDIFVGHFRPIDNRVRFHAPAADFARSFAHGRGSVLAPLAGMSPGESAASYEGSLLWTLEDIGRLISESGDASETLTNVVRLIQLRFETDVCSVYLLEPDRANLVLAATIGLRPESVGRVRMRISEGLAGLVAEQMRPQVFADAATHPRFKYFPEAGEDPYRSFLGVPIVDRGLLQGVLIVQTAEPPVFAAAAVRMLLTPAIPPPPLLSQAP